MTKRHKMGQHTVTSFPAGGALASKSVEMLKPLLQQFLVFGPLVHWPSGTEDEVEACLSTSTREGSSLVTSFGMMAPRASDPMDRKVVTLLSSMVNVNNWEANNRERQYEEVG